MAARRRGPPERATTDQRLRARPPHDRQELADRSAGSGPIAQLQALADRARVGRSISSQRIEGPIQRKIQLNGKELNLGQVLPLARDKHVKVILANWHWSKTVHNFVAADRDKAFTKLADALGRAAERVVDAPGLFRAGNLAFLTKASGRLPTLYFVSGNDSARIRQQHGSGPAVVEQSNKVDYFFPDADKMGAFHAAARGARKKGLAFRPDVKAYGGTTKPTAGYRHYEVTYKGGDKIRKLHPSGGLCDPNVGAYDDDRIQGIYQSAIGRTT